MRFGLLGLIIIPVGILLYKLYEYNKEQHRREVRHESQFTGENQTCCVICLGELGSTKVTRLPCMHKFHTNCIKEVFDHEVNRSCPHCRQFVPSFFSV